MYDIVYGKITLDALCAFMIKTVLSYFELDNSFLPHVGRQCSHACLSISQSVCQRGRVSCNPSVNFKLLLSLPSIDVV